MRRTKRYDKRWWRGVLLNNGTISALERVERRTGLHLNPTQGSYNGGAGRVGASGGTHDGGGAVDLSVKGYTNSEKRLLNVEMRRAGFAGWHRDYIPGLWPEHYHAELIGDRDASDSARAQWAAYAAHRNGLRDNGWDSSWRPRIPRRWSHRLNRIVLHPLPGQKLTPKQKLLLPSKSKR